jgi:hypothetical protein
MHTTDALSTRVGATSDAGKSTVYVETAFRQRKLPKGLSAGTLFFCSIHHRRGHRRRFGLHRLQYQASHDGRLLGLDATGGATALDSRTLSRGCPSHRGNPSTRRTAGPRWPVSGVDGFRGRDIGVRFHSRKLLDVWFALRHHNSLRNADFILPCVAGHYELGTHLVFPQYAYRVHRSDGPLHQHFSLSQGA